MPTAIGAASWKATRSWRANTSCCWPGWARSNRRSPAKVRRLYRRKAASHRRLGHVSGRQAGNQRQREGLFRPQADRPRSAGRLHAAGTAGDSPRRRRRRGQQLHAVLSGACSVRFRTTIAPPCRPSWCCCPIGRRSTSIACRPGRGRSSCRCRSCGRIGHGARLRQSAALVSCFMREPDDWPPLRCPGLAQEHGWFSWERFFRRADASLEWLEARRWIAQRTAPAGSDRRRALDDDALRPQRWPRRDLSADHLEHHRAEMPRL